MRQDLYSGQQFLKAIRIIGTEEEQGTMYGIYYAANGTTAAIIAAVNLWAYNAGGGDSI